MIPTTLSLVTFRRIVDFLGRDRFEPARVMPFFSLADRRKRLHLEIMHRLPLEWPGVLRTVIYSATEIERMGVERAPVGAYAPRSDAARAFRELWWEIRMRLAQQ